MLSHSILLGSNRELRFIGDLTNLCKLHKVSCGDPGDLTHLSDDLLSNEKFRMDLFAFCTAISHMGAVDLSSEQLLTLVARAVGGFGTSLRDPAEDLPQEARSAFLDGYQTWATHEPDPEYDLRPVEPEPSLPAPRPDRRLFYAAAAGMEGDRETEDDPRAKVAANGPVHRLIPPNTPLENLTLSELRMYLEDIENRVRRIEPRLERMASQKLSSAESFEPQKNLPETVDSRQISHAGSPIESHAPEPVIAMETVASSLHQEPAFEAAASSLFIIPRNPLVSDVPSSESTAARLRRLRIINALLTFLLIVVISSVAIFVSRYLRPQPPPLTDPIQQTPAPAADLLSKPSPTDPHINPTQHDDVSRDVLPSPSSLHHPGNIASTDALTEHPQASQSRQTASPAPVTATPLDTINAELPHIQIPEATATSYVNKPITFAPSPAPQPSLNKTASEHASVAEAHPLAAPATTTPPKSAATPASSPVVQPPKPTNLIVAVPSATMMTYALSAPKPIYPRYRHLREDTGIDVEITISKDGKVTSARVLNGTLDVRGAVAQTVQTWRFKPYILDGNPVMVSTTFKFVFKVH